MCVFEIIMTKIIPLVRFVPILQHVRSTHCRSFLKRLVAEVGMCFVAMTKRRKLSVELDEQARRARGEPTAEERRKVQHKRFKASDKKKEANRKYSTSLKGKERQKRYIAPH